MPFAPRLRLLDAQTLADGGHSLPELLESVKHARRDLVFYRTHNGEATTVVDGQFVSFSTPGREIQGGAYSCIRFCVLLVMKVFAPLRMAFPAVTNHKILRR
jgi:hypothetical protein